MDTQPRERATGRYGYNNRRKRLCVCGHPLGVHTGMAPHECIATHFTPFPPPCDCVKFQPAKVKT